MIKQKIGNQMQIKRNNLTLENTKRYDMQISTQLTQLVSDYKHVGIYVSFNGEVDTHQLIQTLIDLEIKVSVPKIEHKVMNFYEINSLLQLQPGHFGVLEPNTGILTDPTQIDLMIVPLLAFNRSGYRVGYGKGYYDHYLKDINPYKVGVAYAFQEVNTAFHEKHDIAMDAIITNEGIIHVKK